jgi:hypothetical protein
MGDKNPKSVSKHAAQKGAKNAAANKKKAAAADAKRAPLKK